MSESGRWGGRWRRQGVAIEVHADVREANPERPRITGQRALKLPPAGGRHAIASAEPNTDSQLPQLTDRLTTAPAMDEYEEAVLFTYALLESRLNRLEYILSGAEKQPEDKPRTLTERIQRLERSLQALSEKTALLDSAQELCMHPMFPPGA